MPTPPDPTEDAPAHALTSSSTPVKYNSQGADRFATRSKLDADLLKINMAKELSGQWVGPMPVDEFISEFLPLPEYTLRTKPAFSPLVFADLVDEAYETDMYGPFIKAVEKSKAMPGFKLVNTSQHADRDAITGMKNKPDVSCYQDTVETKNRPTKFEDIELIFEFKPSRAPADPFEDNPETGEEEKSGFEPKSKDHDVHSDCEKCRGQLACYARIWCARQHRIHSFMIWMGDPYARIIRIDRSGGIVSAKFNYRTQGDLLMQFLWRFSSSGSRARGTDTTVTKASAKETEEAMAALYEWKPTSERSVFKVEVPDSDDKKKPRYVLIWGPLADPRSVTGRATRGFPALDPLGNGGKGSIVFLKDSWRSCEDGMEKEFDILKDLNAKQCRNVPKLICGDDLPDQFTVTKRFAKKPWNVGGRPENIVKRVHSRFAQDFVGYHLETFKSSREFLQAIYDAVLAHKDAFEKCGILHRDISAGNILMRKGGGGILNDWDLAKRIDKQLFARQPFRSGTWQFMSAALLLDPGKINTLQDDLESFFWLVLYYALRYLKHNRNDNLKDIMVSIFDDERQRAPGEPSTGGQGKILLCSYLRLPLHADFCVEGNRPLTIFIKTMIERWEAWYIYSSIVTNKILAIVDLQGISREEAKKKVPIDYSGLDMRDHGGLVSAFEMVLNTEVAWPKGGPGDEPVDRLSKQSKRGLDEIAEDVKHEETAKIPGPFGEENPQEPSSKTTVKRTKTSKKLEDNAAYMPSRSSLSLPQVLFSGSRETRERKGEVNYEESDDE